MVGKERENRFVWNLESAQTLANFLDSTWHHRSKEKTDCSCD